MHRREWILIAIAFPAIWPGVVVFSALSGNWRLLAGLFVLTAISAANAWHAGLPLWPGREPRWPDSD